MHLDDASLFAPARARKARRMGGGGRGTTFRQYERIIGAVCAAAGGPWTAFLLMVS